MVWKKVNNTDPGDANTFGGDDTDKISDLFSGVLDVDLVDINSSLTVRDNKFKLRNPANTFSYTVQTGAIIADRDLNIPLLTGNATMIVTPSETGLNMGDFSINSINVLSLSDTNTSLQQSGTDLQYDVASGGEHQIRINNVVAYYYDNVDFNLNAGRNLCIMGTGASGWIDFNDITTPANPAINVGRLYVKVGGGGSTSNLYFRDNAGLETAITPGSGGGQTPWTTDIDADGWDLNDLSNIEFRNTTGAPGFSTPAIWADSTRMAFNAPFGDVFDFKIGGVVSYLILSDLHLDLVEPTDIRWNANQNRRIRNTTNGFDIFVETGDDIDFNFNAVTEYVFDAVELNMVGNDLVNAGGGTITDYNTVTAESGADFYLVSDTSDSGNLKKVLVTGGGQTPWTQDIDADGFDLLDFGNIEFRDSLTSPAGTVVYLQRAGDSIISNIRSGATFHFRENGTSLMSFGTTKIEFNRDPYSLTWGGGSDSEIGYDSTVGFEYKVPTGETHDFRVQDVSEYVFDATQADFNGNSIVNAVIDDFTNLVLADGQHVQIRNESGLAYAKGDVVHISGYSIGQDLPLTVLADSSVAATMPAIGIVNEVIANNANGTVCISGRMDGLVTGTFTAGDTVYVGETAGEYTNVKPAGTALIQNLGTVLRAHATLGTIEILSTNRANDTPNILTHALDGNNLIIGNVADGVAGSDVATVSQLSSIAQTPWTSDIDANNFSLRDLETLEFDQLGIAPASTVTYIFSNSAGMVLNVPTGDDYTFYVNGTPQMNIDVNQIRMRGNDVVDVSNLEFQNTTGAPAITAQAIWADAGGINLNVPTGDNLEFSVNGNSQMQIANSSITFSGNPLSSIGNITLTGNLILNDSRGLEWAGGSSIKEFTNDLTYGVATTFLHVFQVNSVNEVNITGTEVRILSNDLILNAGDITLTAGQLQFGAGESIGMETNDMVFDVTTGDQFIFAINGVAEYTMNDTELNLTGLNLNGVTHITMTGNLAGATIDGDLNTILDINETQMNVSVGAASTVLTSNGVGLAPTYQAAGGGSQTPWTQDIDADGFDLTDLSNIEFRNSTGAPAGTVTYLIRSGDNLIQNVATGQNHFWTINGQTEMTLNGSRLDLTNNDIINVGLLEINNPADTFQYILTGAAIVADRIVNFPLLTGTDTFVTEAMAQTLTNKTIDGDLNTILDIGETMMNVEVGAASTVLTSNGVGLPPTYQASAGGSDTPWIIDHDADGFDLNDVSNIEFRATATGTPAGTVTYIQASGGDIDINVPTGSQFTFSVNQVGTWFVDATRFRIGSRALEFGQANISITNVGNNLEYDTITGQTHDFRINNVVEMSLSATALDLQGNNLDSVTNITFNADAGQTIINDTGGLEFNLPSVDTYEFFVNSLSEFEITSGSVDLKNNQLIFDTNYNIRKVSTELQFEVPTGGGYNFEINAISEMVLNATTLDLLTNDIDNVGDLTLSKVGPLLRFLRIERPEILSDLATIGLIEFRAFDGVSVNQSYAGIGGNMESDVDTAEEGSMTIGVMEGGSPNNSYITLNLVQSGTVRFWRDVEFGGNVASGFDYLESNATNPALAGVIRLGNTEEIHFRNFANDADMGGIGVNVSDALEINSAVNGSIELQNFGVSAFRINSTNIFLDNAWHLDFQSTSDILNLRNLEFGVSASTPAGTVAYILNDAGGIDLNVDASDTFSIRVNGSLRYNFSNTALNTQNNSIDVGTGALAFNGADIRQISNDLQYNVATTGTHDWEINFVEEMTLSATALNLLGNQLIFDTDQTIQESGLNMQYDTVSSGAHFFRVNDSNEAIIGSGGIDIGAGNLYTVNGTNISPIGIHDIPVAATGMYATTTLGATGPTQVELPTNDIDINTMDFTSTTVDERVQFRTPFPRNYNNGAITVTINWSQSSGTGNVVWRIGALATGQGDLIDQAMTFSADLVDAGGTANQIQSTTTASFTPSGTPADGDELAFEVMRQGSDALDTFSGTARLHSIVIHMTTDAATAA
jgi:hypothetical protein